MISKGHDNIFFYYFLCMSVLVVETERKEFNERPQKLASLMYSIVLGHSYDPDCHFRETDRFYKSFCSASSAEKSWCCDGQLVKDKCLIIIYGFIVLFFCFQVYYGILLFLFISYRHWQPCN